ncbi:MAG: hypothetical protein EXR58_07720 [Chloroflexi bacterium]|nr:hypothetical protein [Chloroflexota bacterium]
MRESLPSIGEVLNGIRFLVGIPEGLRHRLTFEQALATLRYRLEHRTEALLETARRAIYGYPDSPYLPLLNFAGCEYGDLENLLNAEGVEGALHTLYQKGVYLTVEEAKGLQPVVRGSAHMTIDPANLRNPLMGTQVNWGDRGRGRGRSPSMVPARYRERAINTCLHLHARGAEGWVHAIWGVPGGWPLDHLLEYSIAQARPSRWFSSVDPSAAGLGARYLWSGRLLRWASLAAGVRLPPMEYVPLDNLGPILMWMQGVLRSGGPPHIHTFVSNAVRLCAAAASTGVQIEGAEFTVVGEPATSERMAAIRQVGARVAPAYGSTEASYVAKGCLAPQAPDDMHVFNESHALIQPGADVPGLFPGQALLISSLRPTASFILLNASLGDSATLSQQPCGCPMEDLGWTTHLHTIRSFEKLTAGGITFLDVDVIRVLEELLPSRFGGGPTDYQLVEQEGEGGTPQLRLLVHPRLGSMDEDAVANTFLTAIGRGAAAERVAELMWREAGFLQVQRLPPISTSSGKILHIASAPQ